MSDASSENSRRGQRSRVVRRRGWSARSTAVSAPPKAEDTDVTLVEALDRVLSRGVVVQGEVVIAVANIALVYVGVQALLTSVETARQCTGSRD